jgi:hypothetical protein
MSDDVVIVVTQSPPTVISPVIGEKGDKGDSGDSNFSFKQVAASSNWLIDHGLNKFPSVTVTDTSGNVIEGDVKMLTKNTLSIDFSAPFSGNAYLN